MADFLGWRCGFLDFSSLHDKKDGSMDLFLIRLPLFTRLFLKRELL